MNYVTNLFADDKFTKIANNVNPYVFAFDNGVYDLETFTFRDPKREEYITKTCGYEYRERDKQITEKESKVIIQRKPQRQRKN